MLRFAPLRAVALLCVFSLIPVAMHASEDDESSKTASKAGEAEQSPPKDQKTQGSVTGPPGSCIMHRKFGRGERDGYLPQVQAAYQEERKPRQARLGVGSQDVSAEAGPLRQVRLAPRRSRRALQSCHEKRRDLSL